MDKNLYLKIQRPGDTCVNCGADLVAAHKHRSSVKIDDAEENLERRDFCNACWAEMAKEEHFFSGWLAKREVPEERNTISRQDRNRLLLALFELMTAGGDSGSEDGGEVEPESVRYFLGHLLMRFRVFKWHRTEAESGTIFFENVQNGETYSVQAMELDDESIVKIKKVIEEFLRKGQDLDVSL